MCSVKRKKKKSYYMISLIKFVYTYMEEDTVVFSVLIV